MPRLRSFGRDCQWFGNTSLEIDLSQAGRFLLVAILVSVTYLESARAGPRAPVQIVKVTGPVVIGFAPLEVDGQKDDGSIEGVAHTNFALQDTVKCLRPKKVKVEFWFADTIMLVDKGQRATFATSKMGQGFGAILVQPGRKAKVVFSENGPSTLQWLLPNAAFEFWNAPRCKDAG